VAIFGVRRQSAAATPLFLGEGLTARPVPYESGVALRFPPQSKTLPGTGRVEVADKLVRFIRGVCSIHRASISMSTFA